MAETQTVTVPDIGDFDQVDVIEVLVEPGQRVDKEQSLITLESDKATLEVPAPTVGTVGEIHVGVGDKVTEGSAILTLQVDAATQPEQDEAASAGEAPAAAETGAEETKEDEDKAAPGKREAAAAPADAGGRGAQASPASPRPAPATGFEDLDSERQRKAHASPAVRRFARDLGVDLGEVQGSGPKGRILKEDVEAWVKAALRQGTGKTGGIPPVPAVDFSRYGEVETVPLSRIKRKAAPHLHRSWLNLPHVTQFDEADITELEAFWRDEREHARKQGVPLTLLAFLMQACAETLQAFPQVNSSLDPDGEHLVLKRYVHIGIAVDTEGGLLVPVVRDVDRKGAYQLAEEIADLATRARDGKLGPGEMQGASFSISNLGGVGGTAFTPIINAPEVAILGISRTRTQPVYIDGEFRPRRILPLSLSYDHRVIDGAEAARFTTHLCGLLADIRGLLL